MKYFGEVNCPLCNMPIWGYPAISRVDNKTHICSNCGVFEALQAYKNSRLKTQNKSRI